MSSISLATVVPLLLVLLLTATTLGEDVLSCSGYIHSAWAIDFSRVEIALFTEHGSKRDATDCAPKSGYFFLPVEEANYTMKVLAPEGWVVEPKELSLTVDGTNDPCSLRDDLIFEFKGFSVSGRVQRSERDSSGGRMFDKLSLTIRKASGGDVQQTVMADEDGLFVFSALPPNEYVVGLSKESLQSYSFLQKELSVSVRDDSVTVGPFVIAGYDVEGSVLDPEGGPVPDVIATLNSKTDKYTAKTVTDASGKYKFSNVSRGAYVVRLEEKPGIQLSTNVVEISVFDKNAAVEVVRVVEFSVAGRLLWHKTSGEPVADARVTIDGQQVFSDENGVFAVTSKRVGEVAVTAEAEGALFDTTRHKIRPFIDLPIIYPTKFRVSGNVEVITDVTSVQDLRVEVARKGTSFKEVAESRPVDEAGQFSTYLFPGEYDLRIIDLRRQDSKNVYTTDVVKITVQPVNDVNFKVVRFEITGSIKCFDPCKEVKLRLVSERGDVREQTVAGGEFSFKEVHYGGHVLTVKEDKRCWEKPQFHLDVGGSDSGGIEIKQRGFVVLAKATHTTELTLTDQKVKKPQKFHLSEGANSICVEGHSTFVPSASGCYNFDIAPAVITSDTEELTVKVLSYKFSGEIMSVGSDITDAVLKSSTQGDEAVAEEISLTKGKNGIYKFEVSVGEGQEVTLLPSSQEAFFDPPKLVVKANRDCAENKISFKAKRGLFIKGKIVPPVEGVLIGVVGEGTQTALTAKDGTYSIGPFADDTRHDLSASKDGYAFEATQYGTFRSKVLSSIHVNVRDQDSGRGLPDDAVVSVSAGKEFRSSAHLSNGSAAFSSLLPGEYYVKVFLKEWVFEPRHVVVALGEDVHHRQDFLGSRVAFSLFGEARYLNRRPAGGLVVLARGTGECAGQIEDATANAQDGTFRLRGLRPGCQYDLSSGTSASTGHMVTVEKSDVHLTTPLLAQDGADSFHVAVVIETLEEEAANKQVPVVVAEAVSGFRKTFSVWANRATVLPALKCAGEPHYTVQVAQQQPVKVPAQEGTLKYVKAVLKKEVRREKNSNQSSFYILVVVAAAAAGGVVYKRSLAEK